MGALVRAAALLRLGGSWLRLRAAHVGVRAIVLARLAAVDRVPVIAMEDALVEDGAHATEERVPAAVVADVVGLAAGLLVGVHAVLVGQAVAREARLGHPRIGREVAAWLAADGAWSR